jgi:hypothetical protein
VFPTAVFQELFKVPEIFGTCHLGGAPRSGSRDIVNKSVTSVTLAAGIDAPTLPADPVSAQTLQLVAARLLHKLALTASTLQRVGF